MPLISHNQINDMLLHLRKRVEELKPQINKEQTQDRSMELDRLESGIHSLQNNFDWLFKYGKQNANSQSPTYEGDDFVTPQSRGKGPGRPRNS